MSDKTSIFHVHDYSKPIISSYAGFETRHIIFECRCGKRKAEYVYDNYHNGKGFPIETCDVGIKDFRAILAGADYEYLTPHWVVLKKDLEVSK
jgi:hypothetical protein